MGGTDVTTRTSRWLSCVLLAGCTGGSATSADTGASVALAGDASVEERLGQALQDLLAQHPELPGIAVRVRDGSGLDVAASAGVADRATGEALTVDHAFRVASITKTFVAAAALVLVERGELELVTPIADVLDPAFVDLLVADGYDPASILVGHLLDHTSGIDDFASLPDYLAAVAGDPSHRWTPEEQVRFAMDHGAPAGPAGSVYRYSDTGYVVLGTIVAGIAGQPLPGAVRSLLELDGLGLDATHFESLEPAPAGQLRAHQYFGDLDTFTIDPSFDLYGGGGLVSTVGDLVTFLGALTDGEVFDDPATLGRMEAIPATNEAAGAAAGLFRIDPGGTTCWGHSGFWGALAYACDDDVVLAATIGQAVPDARFDLDAVLAELLALIGEG